MTLKLSSIETQRLQVVIKEENNTITVGNIIGYNPTNIIVNSIVLASPLTSLKIYAADGVTLVAQIDNNGNLLLLGQIMQL